MNLSNVQSIDEIRNIINDYLRYYGITLRPDKNILITDNSPTLSRGTLVSNIIENFGCNYYYENGQHKYLNNGKAERIRIYSGTIRHYIAPSGLKDAVITWTLVYDSTGIGAEIYVSGGSTAQSFPAGATYTKCTAFTTNLRSKNCTADAANDKITITIPGEYQVSMSNNGSSGSANVSWHSGIFLTDSANPTGIICPNIMRDCDLVDVNTKGSFSNNGSVRVENVPADIDFRIRHDDAGAVNFTVVNANISVIHIGSL
jgi:hypothetical protein